MHTTPSHAQMQELLNVSFVLNKTGEIIILPWFEVNGVSLSQPSGKQTMQTVSKDNKIIDEFKFTPDFRVLFEPTGIEEFDEAFIVAELPFDSSIDRIVYRNESGRIVFSVDPLRKMPKDYIETILEACPVEKTKSDQIVNLSKKVDENFENNSLSKSTIENYENIIEKISAFESGQCQFGGTPFASVPDFVNAFGSLVEKLKIREGLDPP